MYLDFLIIRNCSQAKSTFIQGDPDYLREFKSPNSILKMILDNSKSDFQINTFDLYKYGHQLRKQYLNYCTGFLTIDQKINSSAFTLKNTKLKLPLVSILTCTNRPGNLLDHTIKQVIQQNYPNLEWVVMVHGSVATIDIDAIRMKLDSFNIKFKIFPIDKEIKLGSMLNIGVSECNGEFIAKFDDDDFYLPNYLMNSINEAIALKADLVGKWMEFTYYESEKKVFYDKGPTLTYVETEHISGSSLVFKRSLFNENFKFYDVTHGEDVFFRNLLINSGKKVYRIHGFDHIVFRSENLKNHTWQISDRYLVNETLVRNNELKLIFDLNTAQKNLQVN
jgi:glycosyltransferase involved in cell wall biosynthesis